MKAFKEDAEDEDGNACIFFQVTQPFQGNIFLAQIHHFQRPFENVSYEIITILPSASPPEKGEPCQRC